MCVIPMWDSLVWTNSLCRSRPCRTVLQCSWRRSENDTNELFKPRVWNHQCVLSFECFLRKSCMTDLEKKHKKKQRRPCVIHCERKPRPPRGHQSCQLLVFLKATKHTPVNVCECEFVCACVCVCIFISGGQFRVRLALSELQREQFGQLWLAGEQLKHWRWLQRRH